MKSYRAIFERDESGTWLARVPSIRGCHSYGRTLEQARTRLRETLGVWIDRPEQAVIKEEIRLPADLRAAVQQSRRTRERAERERENAQEETRAAAEALVQEGVRLLEPPRGAATRPVYRCWRANSRIPASSPKETTAPSAPASSIASTFSGEVRGMARSSGCCSLTWRTCSASEPRDGCHTSPSSSAGSRAPSSRPPRSPAAATGAAPRSRRGTTSTPLRSRARRPRARAAGGSPRRHAGRGPRTECPMKSYSSSCQPIRRRA